MNEYLFTEKYRPKTISECVLPTDLKKDFQTFVDKRHVPNLLLAGGAGVGKTTVARAMLEQLGCDYIIINASMRGNIDTLRTEIMDFASTVSFAGGKKYVILDEADYLNPNSTQPALRNFMEEFSDNCGFILTCNYKNKIISPLRSRCSVIDFNIPKDQKKPLAKEFLVRLMGILDKEEITYNNKVLGELVVKHFPDWRRILNECQRYGASGSIDSGVLTTLMEENFRALIAALKDKKFTEMRKWVAENSDIEQTEIMRKLFDMSSSIMKEQAIPGVVLILSKYMFQSAFAVDAEINLAACLTEIMIEDAFK